MFPGGADYRLSSMTRVNALLDSFGPLDSMGRQRLEIAQDLADGIDELTGRLKISNRRITAAVKASGTSLTDICGLGPITAAIIIVVAIVAVTGIVVIPTIITLTIMASIGMVITAMVIIIIWPDFSTP